MRLQVIRLGVYVCLLFIEASTPANKFTILFSKDAPDDVVFAFSSVRAKQIVSWISSPDVTSTLTLRPKM